MSGILLVIDGAFGLTKDLLSRYGDSGSERCGTKLMRKYTIAGDEGHIYTTISVDLDEVDRDQFSAIRGATGCYHYQLTGQDYAFLPEDLERNLGEVETLLLVVRDLNMLKTLKKRYEGRAYAVYVWMDPKLLEKEIRKSVGKPNIPRHLKRHAQARNDFSSERGIYDHVLLNDGNSDDLFRQLEAIIRMCRRGH